VQQFIPVGRVSRGTVGSREPTFVPGTSRQVANVRFSGQCCTAEAMAQIFSPPRLQRPLSLKFSLVDVAELPCSPQNAPNAQSHRDVTCALTAKSNLSAIPRTRALRRARPHPERTPLVANALRLCDRRGRHTAGVHCLCENTSGMQCVCRHA
jgi:hypothetical protein